MSKLNLEYTGSGGGKRYTIASKIRVVEAIKASKCSINHMSEQTGVAGITITQWVGDYNMGKYTLENTTQIVRKPKTSLQIVLEEARAKVSRIEALVAALEAEGIKVA